MCEHKDGEWWARRRYQEIMLLAMLIELVLLAYIAWKA